MTKYIIRELAVSDSEHEDVQHIVHLPNYNESGWYRLITSIGAFSNGNLKSGVSKKMKSVHRDTCVWNHLKKVVYIVKTEEEYNNDIRQNIISMNIAKSGLGDEYKDIVDRGKFVEHSSLYDFYDYIGFDRKRRCYRRIK